jgi:hypothetical protein
MELLLNLAWLLLAMPAYWLWHKTRPVDADRSARPLQAVLALGCALVILFPVISATDDLHVIGTEIEEPSASKRGIRQGDSDRYSVWDSRLQVHSALPRTSDTQTFGVQRADLPLDSPCLPLAGRTLLRAGRSPPKSDHVL